MCCLSVKSYVASIRDAPAQECHEFPVSSWGLCVVFPVSGSQAFLVLFFVPADFPRACVCVCVRYRNASLAFSRSGRWLVEGRYGYGYGYAMLLVGVLWVLPMLALALLSSDGDGRVDTGWRLLKPHGHPDRESTESSAAVDLIPRATGCPVRILMNHKAPVRRTPIRNPPNAIPRTAESPNSKLGFGFGIYGLTWKFLLTCVSLIQNMLKQS